MNIFYVGVTFQAIFRSFQHASSSARWVLYSKVHTGYDALFISVLEYDLHVISMVACPENCLFYVCMLMQTTRLWGHYIDIWDRSQTASSSLDWVTGGVHNKHMRLFCQNISV